MVDDRMSLAFSVRNNPGRYALLIGSGVSTGAGIPTGWAVVEDLLEKLAAARGGYEPEDPFEWYKEEYGEEARYDDIIGELADSKEERRALLEDYFEATEEEREAGDKTPTDAHRAIAWLVDEGYVNVIITTNFDRLLERAMEERGVTPVTVTGAESASGAEPLEHQDAIVVKVNGDYKETDIRNLASELGEYPDSLQRIIDQTFRNYGLVVCGWSAEWDERLRESLRSCETHRYSTYWCHRSGLEDQANQLVEHRGGNPIQIEGAAPFFLQLKERVQALEGAEAGAPLTRETARERAKRYLPREERRIDLADLLKETTEKSREEIFDQDKYPLSGDDVDVDSRLSRYGSAVGTLTSAVMACSYWGGETVNDGIEPVYGSIQRLGKTPSPGSYNRALKVLRRYPASFVFYGAGTTALESSNWTLLNKLLIGMEVTPHAHGAGTSRTGKSPCRALHPWRIGGAFGSGRNSIESDLRKSMKRDLREYASDLIPDEERFENSFERFETLVDMRLIEIVAETGNGVRLIDPTYWDNRITEFKDALEAEGDDWPPLQAGLFDSSTDQADHLLNELREVPQW